MIALPMTASSSEPRSAKGALPIHQGILPLRETYHAPQSKSNVYAPLVVHRSSPPCAPSPPLRSPRPLTQNHTFGQRASTPSVSPLSNASRGRMETSDTSRPATSALGAPTKSSDVDRFLSVLAEADKDDETRSSSLSEFDGSIEDEEQQGSVQRDTTQHDDDSEAETERLESSPQKLSRAGNGDAGILQTPSKLRQVTHFEEAVTDPESPLSESDMHEALVNGGSPTRGYPTELVCKKRKRPGPGDSPLTSQLSLNGSPRKRSDGSRNDTSNHEVGSAKETGVTASAGTAIVDGTAEDVEGLLEAETTTTREVTPASPVKGAKVKRGRQKVKRSREVGRAPKANGRIEVSPELEDIEAVAELEQDEACGAAVSEEDCECPPNSATEAIFGKPMASSWLEVWNADMRSTVQKKGAAVELFKSIEKRFATFARKLNHDRLTALDAELEMLYQPKPTHPEYLAKTSCINAYRDNKLKVERVSYNYKMQQLELKRDTGRDQAHSQYFQEVREYREEAMERLGDQLYKIQKERRQLAMSEEPDYIYKFPTKRSEQVRQQTKINREVSILSGIKKNIGMPAAPGITGPQAGDIERDLQVMGVRRLFVPV
ncbi:Transcriptional regulatory protein [Elasticomyces elasticus]|nr:Transcriptional regulatory protein [Elasticomyces elasticus]